MRNRRKSYKRENIIKIDKNNVSNINPFVIYTKNEKTGKDAILSLEHILTNQNYFFLKKYKLFIDKKPTYVSKKSHINHIKSFLSFIDIENIKSFNEIDQTSLIKYKIFLDDKFNNIATKNKYYQVVTSFLIFLSNIEPEIMNIDILNFDIPKSFKNKTKGSYEKDLEHNNLSYNSKDYLNLINSLTHVIKNKNSSYNDKIVSYLALFAAVTGVNSEVLFRFNYKDLNLLSQNFEYLEFYKIKNKKGFGQKIRVIVKNYNINNVSLSDLSYIILKEQEKYRKKYSFQHEIQKDILFFYIPNEGLYKNKEYILNSMERNYKTILNRVIDKNNIQFEDNFTLSRLRKQFERIIHKNTNNIQITSSILGHTSKVAYKNYLNTSSNIKSHQKLALTQDLIEAFSVNEHTDNFVTYQELLDFFNIELEEALELAKKGFPINDIIDLSQKDLK